MQAHKPFFLSICVYLHLCQPVRQPKSVAVGHPTCPPAHLLIHISVCLSVCQFVILSFCKSFWNCLHSNHNQVCLSYVLFLMHKNVIAVHVVRWCNVELIYLVLKRRRGTVNSITQMCRLFSLLMIATFFSWSLRPWSPPKPICVSVFPLLIYRSVCICLFVCLFFLSLCLCLCMLIFLTVCLFFLSLCLFLCMSMCPSVCHTVRPSICSFVHLSICLSVSNSICLFVVYLFVCLYFCVYICVSVCVCVCLHVHPSFRLFYCLSACPSFRPSIRLFFCPSVSTFV